MKAKILIVEDQFIEANNLQMILERAGYQVCPIARSVPVALKIIEKENPNLVLLDIYLQGDLTGIDLAHDLRKKNIAFVYISANSNKQILDAAKSTRPYGFLVKPFREKDVLVMLDVAWYLHQENQEAITKSNLLLNVATVTHEDDKLKRIIGVSQDMLEIMDNIKIVSQSNTSVLIVGESGTGKELVAQAIHSISLRKNKPLVVVNCGTLPANLVESELFGHEKGAFTGAINKKTGKFELANGGTIFLDEVGELPLELQVKFLRVLQEQEMEPIGGRLRKIDVRVIAATNRNLEEEIVVGRFRIDLYYRLNVFPIALPPLRERKADILSLANHFLKLYASREGKNIKGFSENVVNLLLTYNWPGNIRELEHLIQRSVLLATSDTIREIQLPSGTKSSAIKRGTEELAIKTIDENERDYILKILKHVKGRISGDGGAAELLGVPPSTLNSRIKRLGIRREHFG